MMAEYIDRNAFKAKYLCCGFLDEISEKEFDRFPAADVAPVVHGRWLPRRCFPDKRLTPGPSDNDSLCSVCRKEDILATAGGEMYLNPPYCMWCGAKMDEGNEP